MASDNLSVLVIDENRIRASVIEAGLREAGYVRVEIINELTGVAQHIQRVQPDVIVIDIESPNRDMLESVFALTRSLKRPIAMFVDRSDQQQIENAVDAGVSAYVVDGLRKERVKPILDMAVSRFRAFSRMERELEDARNELQGRKTIDQAKRLLMDARKVSEDEAYHMMRRSAMDQNRKLSEIAQSIVSAASLFGTGGSKTGGNG
jgi:response regulator NasT